MQFFRNWSTAFCLQSESTEPEVEPVSLPQPVAPNVNNASQSSSGNRVQRTEARFIREMKPLLEKLKAKDLGEQSLGEFIASIIQLFPEDSVRVELISCITSHLRKSFNEELTFLQLLVSLTLNESEQNELHDMLVDLPRGVLGDKEHQEEIRVFVDALGETKNAIQLHRKSFSRIKKYKNASSFLEDIMASIVLSLSDPTMSSTERMKHYSSLQSCLKSPLSSINIGML